jgi:hypothetical protein
LDVEDFFDSVGESEGREGGAGGDVDEADAALELFLIGRDGGGAEDGGLADPGEADEGEVAVEGEPAGVAGDGGDGARCPVPGARCPVPGVRCPVPGARCPVPGDGVDVFDQAEAGVEDEPGCRGASGESAAW